MNWPARTSFLATLFEYFCRFVLKYYAPLSSFGQENIPKAPFILASNHQSHMDSAMLMVGASLDFKNVGLIAARDYFFDKFHRRVIQYILNLVPITRGKGPKAIRETVDSCQEFLSSGGEVLVIYPEGTRTLNGDIRPFKQGSAILAHELNIPLVPCLIEGSFKAFPKGSIFIKPKKVSVTFGKAFKVSDFLDKNEPDLRKATFNAYRLATEELERRVRELCRPAI